MSLNVEGNTLERMRWAYRLAQGIAESEDSIHPSPLARTIEEVTHFIDRALPDYRRQQGIQTIQRLLTQTGGIFKRGEISYGPHSPNTAFENRRFSYDLYLEGVDIGEEGVLALPQKNMPLWYKKGKERLVEVTGEGKVFLYLSEYEEIKVVDEKGWESMFWTPPAQIDREKFALVPNGGTYRLNTDTTRHTFHNGVRYVAP